MTSRKVAANSQPSGMYGLDACCALCLRLAVKRLYLLATAGLDGTSVHAMPASCLNSQSAKQSCCGFMHGMLGPTSHAVQLQGDATGWADEFGGVSQAAEQWADQFAEQVVPNEEVCSKYSDSSLCR